MILLSSITFLLYALIAVAAWCRRRTRSQYASNTIGFIHPAAVAGGGGERVLWMAIDGLMKEDMARRDPREYVVFCLPPPGAVGPKDEALLARVQTQFGIVLPRPVRFVYLHPYVSKWLDGSSYPFATLLWQTVVGGALLFFECALVNCVPPLLVETVGIPMMYPLLRFAGCRVVAYVHYPVISSRMTDMVRSGVATTTNKGLFVTLKPFRWMKVCYYMLFMLFYCLLGQFPDVVLTNSSWTNGHISALFKPRRTHILFPPCGVKKRIFPERDEAKEQSRRNGFVTRRNRIVSLGQFRPEKNHELQIRAFRAALPCLPSGTMLVLLGGARNESDLKRVHSLTKLVETLELSSSVEIRVNEPHDVVQQELSFSLIGLHTMRDEHFGIVIVEYMAAGCLVLAHRSGGVAADIINRPELGFLAETEEEYAKAMVEIFSLHRDQKERVRQIRAAAQVHAMSFDDEVFQRDFVMRIRPLLAEIQETEDSELPFSNDTVSLEEFTETFRSLDRSTSASTK